MKVLRIAVVITAMFAAAVFGSEQQGSDHQEWSYEGPTGPLNWGKLPGNEMCGTGRNQSPVNIEAAALNTSARPLRPHYAAGSKDILNNGHTIQIDFENGDTLAVDNATFTLQQMHFHAPSENQIAGHSFPMEAHFVHTDPQGNLLVVAVMFKEGAALPALDKVSAAMPQEPGLARPLVNAVAPMAFLPKSRSYYRFSGSLTTPPCTEGVLWVVLETPVSASKTQIEAFEHAIKHHNNRPVQPLNGRVVIEKK